jgi:hypothetical protein
MGIYVGDDKTTKTKTDKVAVPYSDKSGRFEWKEGAGQPYNVIESIPGHGVIRSYYKNIENFAHAKDEVFMGFREPAIGTQRLTDQQRQVVVDYVEKQVGKSYSEPGDGFFDFFEALWQYAEAASKGPKFSCVGLYEAALEEAGYNNGRGIFTGYEDIYQWNPYLPMRTYNFYRGTIESGKIVDASPKITNFTLTPNYGTPSTRVLLEVHVTHPDGLSSIQGVRYMIKENGYCNPNIYINDNGSQGDKVAGDGIYSSKNPMGAYGLSYATFRVFVTDKNSREDTAEAVYTYTSSSNVSSNANRKFVVDAFNQ